MTLEIKEGKGLGVGTSAQPAVSQTTLKNERELAATSTLNVSQPQAVEGYEAVRGSTSAAESARAVTLAPADYFDPPAPGKIKGGFRVVGSIVPKEAGAWGRISLLEGGQRFLSEGYNDRTERVTKETTFNNSEYPLRRYFGDLNQHLVDGFNMHYAQQEAADPARKVGATRPEARFALLHEGPKTAAGDTNPQQRPVLLVHGAMQDANVWLWPAGYDGEGSYESADKPVSGMVQALEDKGVPTYAVTFGNSHGSTLSHAIQVANAIQRIKDATGCDKVDVVAWSKGGVPVDLYLADVAKWDNWGTDHFARVKQLQAEQVPAYDGSIGHYISLGSPHGGLDLNWRHPFNNQVIFAADPTAPAGRGPMAWGQTAAMQSVSFGMEPLLEPWGIDNPFAKGISEGRGGTWPDYWHRVHTSNIVGLDADGRPLYDDSLRQLNVTDGADTEEYNFDAYNLAMWGSVDANGRPVLPYAGQLELTHDYREQYPITRNPTGKRDNPDSSKWYTWLGLKTWANPMAPAIPAGGMLTSLEDSRRASYDPKLSCEAFHLGQRQKVFDSIGIESAQRMGGNLIQRLRQHSLSANVDSVRVIHGTRGEDASNYFNVETDGASDGVVFEDSGGPGALARLTQDWSQKDRRKAHVVKVEADHLGMGADPHTIGHILDTIGA